MLAQKNVTAAPCAVEIEHQVCSVFFDSISLEDGIDDEYTQLPSRGPT